MTAITHGKHEDFHWTPVNLSLAILWGVAATVTIWLFTGLLIGLFFL